MQIIEESWDGARQHESERTATSTADVDTAIDRLDGARRNLVVLALPERSLSIGGGSGGRYVAHLTVGVDDAFYSIVDPQKSADATVDLMVGGQLSSFPARQCVDKAAVTEAARYFMEHDGAMSPAVPWEEQT
jgi:hypothetical protein